MVPSPCGDQDRAMFRPWHTQRSRSCTITPRSEPLRHTVDAYSNTAQPFIRLIETTSPPTRLPCAFEGAESETFNMAELLEMPTHSDEFSVEYTRWMVLPCLSQQHAMLTSSNANLTGSVYRLLPAPSIISPRKLDPSFMTRHVCVRRE